MVARARLGGTPCSACAQPFHANGLVLRSAAERSRWCRTVTGGVIRPRPPAPKRSTRKSDAACLQCPTRHISATGTHGGVGKAQKLSSHALLLPCSAEGLVCTREGTASSLLPLWRDNGTCPCQRLQFIGLGCASSRPVRASAGGARAAAEHRLLIISTIILRLALLRHQARMYCAFIFAVVGSKSSSAPAT